MKTSYLKDHTMAFLSGYNPKIGTINIEIKPIFDSHKYMYLISYNGKIEFSQIHEHHIDWVGHYDFYKLARAFQLLGHLADIKLPLPFKNRNIDETFFIPASIHIDANEIGIVMHRKELIIFNEPPIKLFVYLKNHPNHEQLEHFDTSICPLFRIFEMLIHISDAEKFGTQLIEELDQALIERRNMNKATTNDNFEDPEGYY